MRIMQLIPVCLFLALAACSWSVAADPAHRDAVPRKRAPIESSQSPASAAPPAEPRQQTADEGVGAIYAQRCAACHELFPRTYATAGEWTVFVARYAPRAGLFGQERERVLRWLQAGARR